MTVTTCPDETTVGPGSAATARPVSRADIGSRVGRRFRTDIEGLRGIAVILVVAYHCGLGAVSGGYVGVDVFFVVSGYLITEQLYHELAGTGRISLAGFYARRMTRLLPAAVLVIIATLAAAWHWMPPLTARVVSQDALAAVGYAINVRLAAQGTDYLGALREPSPLQHFWSLAVEEQFYLVWPVLLLIASLAWARRGRPSRLGAAGVLLVLGVASLALCVWQTTHALPWAYFGSPARAWELTAGALVALAAPRLVGLARPVATALSWLGLAMVLVAAGCFTDETVFPGYAATLPVAGTALVIAAGCAGPRRGAGTLLRIGPMQEIGRLSYSWYLWHWPILMITPHVLGREPGVLVKGALMLAALVPASMSLAAVENRVRFHRVFRARPRRGLLLGAGLTAVGASLALLGASLPVTISGSGSAVDTAALVAATNAASPRRLAELIATSATATRLPGNLVPGLTHAVEDYPHDGNCTAPVTEASINYNISMGCEQHGYRTAATTVVLFGDSHAGHWFDALEGVAEREHWRLVIFVKGGCAPAMALTYKNLTSQPYLECVRWRAEALARIEKLRPAMVVMSSLSYGLRPLHTTGSADDEWVKAWLATAARIRRAGAQPVIIQDTPRPATSVPDCLSAHPRQIQRCNLDPAVALDAGRRAAIAAAAASHGIRVVDPRPWFCTPRVCPAVVGNTLVYRDNSHITATYSKLLVSSLAAALVH